MTAAETLELLRLAPALRTGGREQEALAALQLRRFRAAISHAYERIPFYGDLWAEHGFHPSRVRSLDDLRRLPIVTPPVARSAVARGTLIATNARPERWPTLSTSGSSGAPVNVCCGPVERWLWRTLARRIWREHGARLHDRTIRFDAHGGLPDLPRRLGISTTAWVSTALPDRQRLERFLEARAAVVVGTPTSLRSLARAIAVGGAPVPRPRVVIAQGEILDAATGSMVRSALGIEPASVYGLTEVGYVAWQCERREGFHVNADAFLVEVLRHGRPAGPGELGALVVTDLLGRARPLLRYDTGDLAIAEGGACPCGRSLPTIASVEGRAADALTLPDGRVLTALAVVDGLAAVVDPDDYRLHQESPGRFRLTLGDARFGDAPAERLRALLGNVDLRVETGTVTREAGDEKTRSVSSDVPIDVARPR